MPGGTHGRVEQLKSKILPNLYSVGLLSGVCLLYCRGEVRREVGMAGELVRTAWEVRRVFFWGGCEVESEGG